MIKELEHASVFKTARRRTQSNQDDEKMMFKNQYMRKYARIGYREKTMQSCKIKNIHPRVKSNRNMAYKSV